MRYTFSIHIPLLRGDEPTVAVLRHEKDKIRVIMFREIRERDFHSELMPYIGRLATEIASLERRTWIDCHLVFSGRGYMPDGYHALMAGRWPAQSYSLVTMTPGGEHDYLEGSGADRDLFYPINHFIVPRVTVIGALNLAYAEPGLVTVAVSEQDKAMISSQLSVFAERANRISSNDPEAMLEYKGEGMVVAWGIGLWHAFRADMLRNEWGKQWKIGEPSKVLASI